MLVRQLYCRCGAELQADGERVVDPDPDFGSATHVWIWCEDCKFYRSGPEAIEEIEAATGEIFNL